ncbi:hypothetical protein HaLaN_06883, partial [Haematococcus lacustris]
MVPCPLQRTIMFRNILSRDTLWAVSACVVAIIMLQVKAVTECSQARRKLARRVALRGSEFISSQWCQEHGVHLAASVLVMLAFRVLSSFLDVKLKRYYATPTDVGNAVYRSVGLVHHTIQVPLAILVLCNPAFWHDRLHHSSPLSFAMVIISSGPCLHPPWPGMLCRVSVQPPAVTPCPALLRRGLPAVGGVQLLCAFQVVCVSPQPQRRPSDGQRAAAGVVLLWCTHRMGLLLDLPVCFGLRAHRQPSLPLHAVCQQPGPQRPQCLVVCSNLRQGCRNTWWEQAAQQERLCMSVLGTSSLLLRHLLQDVVLWTRVTK